MAAHELDGVGALVRDADGVAEKPPLLLGVRMGELRSDHDADSIGDRFGRVDAVVLHDMCGQRYGGPVAFAPSDYSNGDFVAP